MTPPPLLILVDADMMCGWRRASPSLQQLHEAVDHLRLQEPDAEIAVIGDAALKWVLSPEDQESLEDDIVARRIVFAPAGSADGQPGFIREICKKAKAQGKDVVVVTDRSIPGPTLGRVRREHDGTWVFDLAGVETTVVAEPISPYMRRKRRSSAA